MNRFSGTLATILVLAGCTFGRSFDVPPDEQLVLGRTTDSELRARLGAPVTMERVGWNEHALTAWTYFQGSRNGVSASHAAGTTPTRGLTLYFLKGLLVGYDRWSSFKEGHTDFDDGQIGGLLQGASTKKDVTDRLGPATGRYGYPMLRTPSHDGLTWTYLHLEGARIFRKHVVLTVDADGRIVDLEYRSIGPN